MLFLHFKKASISNFISFSQGRVPCDEIKKIIREFDTVGNINQDELRQWKDLMTEHNRIIERGERMLLLQNIKSLSWIKFQNLDLFMLQTQSRRLATLLECFSSFGERVLRLIQESPASLIWVIGEQVVVERTSWCRLCSQMMTLLHVLCLADPSSVRLRLRPWPDRELLEAAAARARGVFGRFARADTAVPSMRALPSRQSLASDRHAAAMAAIPGRRAARRRQEDREPPCHAVAAADSGGGFGAGSAPCPPSTEGPGPGPHPCCAGSIRHESAQ